MIDLLNEWLTHSDWVTELPSHGLTFWLMPNDLLQITKAVKFGWNLLGIYSFFVKELKNEPNFLIAFRSFSYVNQT